MAEHVKIKLVSSEIANLWKTYMFETINRCVLQHFMETVDDQDIKTLTQTKLEAKESRIQQLTAIFNQEGIPTPVGFTDRDVNVKAPRLFTDVFMAEYLYFMSAMGLEEYARAMSTSPRADIRQYFFDGLTFFADIQIKIMDLLLQKGIFTRAPFIPYPKQVEFVQKQSMLTGWLGERKPLHAMQINHLFLNIKRNALGKEMLTGFSQTCKFEDIQTYMVRGKEISTKLIKVFSDTLQEDDITPPTFGGIGVTDSKEAPFTDKLMLNLIMSLDAYGFSIYGLSLAESIRRDLYTKYSKIMAEIGAYGQDGMNLMIEHGYMEDPPKAADREKIAKG